MAVFLRPFAEVLHLTNPTNKSTQLQRKMICLLHLVPLSRINNNNNNNTLSPRDAGGGFKFRLSQGVQPTLRLHVLRLRFQC